MMFKGLWRRPVRSLLTIAGIAIGVAAIVSLSAMAQGFARNYGAVLSSGNALMVTQANAYDVSLSSLDEDMGLRIRGVPGVANVDGGIFTYVSTEGLPYFLVFGYEPGTVAAQHYRIVEGKPVTGDRQIAIGRRGAAALKKGLDGTLRIYGVPYRIVGIYETGQGMEESGGLVTLSDAQGIAGKPRKVSLFQVGLQRGTDADLVMQRLRAVSKEMTASKASEYSSGQAWTSLIQTFAWCVAAIAILVGGLGMMNAMVMSVLERTREIGTLRALGWGRGRVIGLILGEALLVSLVGGGVGMAGGVLLTSLAASIPGLGAFLEGVYSPQIFLQGLVTALGLGLLGGLYPAWKAANLQPVEALRYEGGSTGQVGGWLSRVGSQSLRNLWRRRTRTLLSASGVGIGVATLVMLEGLAGGLSKELNSLAGSGGTGSITVMQKDLADMSLSTLDERLVGQIQAIPGVRSASPLLMGYISTPELLLFILQGLDPRSPAMEHYRLVEGRMMERPNEIVVGKTAARNYNLPLGSTLSLYNTRYKVVGIYETGVAWEEGGGLLALQETQRLLNWPRSVSFIFVEVADPAVVEQVRGTINRRFAGVQASLSSQFAQQSGDMARVDTILNAISALALLVGGILVANTMIMSIHERTREIGTLRALGWRPPRILGQILQESLLLCLLAGVLGSLLGVAVILLLAGTAVGSAFLTPYWDLLIFVRAIGLMLAVGLVGGALPAWRAAHLQPVEALRYE